VSWEQHADQNRRAWNEVAQVRSRSYRGAVHPAAFFADGGSALDPRVTAAAGDVRGRRLLHLMCATGEETLSWSVLGADAVGVDISDAEIALAREKAIEAGLPTRFVAADVGALPPDLADGSFDLVYTATGVLVWIPDIDRWAAVISRALAPGGRFLLFEAHPVEMCLWGVDGRVEITEDYFDTGRPVESVGWSHFEGAEGAREVSVEFGWTLGQLVTALATAGLRIERLDEFPTESEWRFGEAMASARRLPGTVLLVARNA
jgi:SAM-dependent methyltransferase